MYGVFIQSLLFESGQKYNVGADGEALSCDPRSQSLLFESDQK